MGKKIQTAASECGKNPDRGIILFCPVTVSAGAQNVFCLDVTYAKGLTVYIKSNTFILKCNALSCRSALMSAPLPRIGLLSFVSSVDSNITLDATDIIGGPYTPAPIPSPLPPPSSLNNDLSLYCFPFH